VRDRYAIGLERLSAIDGRDGHAVVESLKEISPDFARYLIEFPFGDIYARPGLDCQTAFKRDPRSASKRDPLFR